MDSRVMSGIAGRQGGFTLIEMIGVLAIIAILSAAIAPRVFEVIADSRGTRMATEVRAIETAVTRYYGDVGTIRDLAADGTLRDDTDGSTYYLTLTSRVPNGTAGAWRRFSGPYLEKFVTGAPAVGTSQLLLLKPAKASATAATATNEVFDLDGTTPNNDTPGTAGGGNDGPQRVVYLEVTGVNAGDFAKVDSIFDEGVSGTKEITGRVKYETTGTNKMLILIAYR